MAGHSHAKNVMHRKNAQDKKKAKIYAKLAKAISAAAQNDSNVETNLKLKFAIKQAQLANVPKNIIENAVNKKSKEKTEEIIYEGYSKNNEAILVKVLTDNRNKTSSQIKEIFKKNNGKIAKPNEVKFLFQEVGEISVNGKDFETFTDDLIEFNLIDFDADFKITCELKEFHKILNSLEKKYNILSAEINFISKSLIPIENKEELEELLNALEENEDVLTCYHNAEISDD